MNYTIGNWTVASQTTDTISTAKTPSIVDLDYASDFTLASEKPTEVQLANITGLALTPVETLRYARSKVDDVYAMLNTGIDDAHKANAKSGTSLLTELTLQLKATNSVSGEEILLPMRGRIVLVAPTVSFVGPDALKYLLLRTISAGFGTGEVIGTQAVNMARGDLDPRS